MLKIVHSCVIANPLVQPNVEDDLWYCEKMKNSAFCAGIAIKKWNAVYVGLVYQRGKLQFKE